MLRPSKHSHPDRTTLNAALVILTKVKAMRVYDYAQLKSHVSKAVDGGDVLFQPALNLLFLLGLIDYRPKTDAFEYTGSGQ